MTTFSEIDAERGNTPERALSDGALSERVLPRASHGVRSGAVRIVRAYQLARSGRPSPCRFVPSCSEYAAEALERHGVGRGGLLALRRVLRCHPWGSHGLDPVPERRASR